MYSAQQKGMIKNIERNNFRELKKRENLNKNFNILSNKDILDTKNFTFQKFNHLGDSGNLQIATNKKNKEERYIVKHDYYDCACNEYMYSKIGNEMGIAIAPVKLFLITDKEKNFKSDFVCGVKYYNEGKTIGYKEIISNKNDISNWKDYFRFLGMESLFSESDGIEVIKEGNFIYRIDTTAAFSISHIYISYLAYDFEYQGATVREFVNKMIQKLANFNIENVIDSWKIEMDIFKRNYEMKYFEYYLEPFKLFLEIDEKKIEEWSKNVTYFYPDIIGEYYKTYFKNLKKAVKIFLKEIE